MSSGIEDGLCLVPFEVFTQVAFEREFFRRKLLQCEVALRHSAQLADSLQRCLEFWNCSAGLPTHSSEPCLPAKHRTAISVCTQTLMDFCDEIIQKTHGEMLLQCTSAAISEARDQAHTHAVTLANAAETKAFTHFTESEYVKGELVASQHSVSVLRRRVDALEHLLDQEREQVHVKCMRQAEECAAAVLLQSQALHSSMSLRIDALASQLKQVSVCLIKCCSVLSYASHRMKRG
jgi:predicted nucleic acid-binding protein